MRWLVTLLLSLLVVAGGVWLVAPDRVQTALGVRPPDASDGPSQSLALLDQYLKPDRIRELKVGPADKPTLTLTRAADGTWTQPGNWPLREAEVATLVNTLAGLRTRFAPVRPEDAPTDPATAVTVAATVATDSGSRVLTLKFGRPPATPGEPEFARPCYLRVDDLPEAVRLGPDVYPVLARPAEVYRRRQLFPDADRVKLAGGDPPPSPDGRPTPAGGRVALLTDRFSKVRVEKTDGGTARYTLTRTAPTPAPRRDPDRPSAEPAVAANDLAAAWTLELEPTASGPVDPAKLAPIKDRPDPAKLRAALTAVPDLWVDGFAPAGTTLAAAGLEKPGRTLTVTRTDGTAVTLLIGNVSRTTTKTEDAAPPRMPGMPPTLPKTVTEEFRYAKLKDNDLIFEVKGDKLSALFADPQDLRDPQLARFTADEVTELTVAVPGKPVVKLTRKKGNKDADTNEDRQDRWYVGDLLAEGSKVTELLDALARLEAKGKENIQDNPDAAKLKEQGLDAGTTVTVVAQAKAAEGETPPPARTFTFAVGKLGEAKKLPVRVNDWPRVNLVDDSVLKLIDRPALAYRGRRLFDTAEAKLDSVTVSKDGKPAFALAGPPKWKLTQPVQADADDAKASQLTGDLSRLEAVEYVDDAPKPEDIETKYGLAKPRLTVALGFTGPGAKPQTLDLGSAREGKPEVYARLNGGGSVFTVPKATVDPLDAGAVALLPLQLWQTAADKVTSVAVERDGEKYTLTAAGAEWKLSGPFDAAASVPDLQPLLAAASAVRADKVDALAADPAKHGFDKPALKLTVSYKETPPAKPGEAPPAEATVSKTLVVGKEAGGGTRYAKLDAGPTAAVYVLPDALFKEADRPALARLDKTLLAVEPDKVTKVQIAGPRPEDAVTLVKNDKGEWAAEGSAFAVDKPTVSQLVAAACRPPVSRLSGYGPKVDWAALGLDKPEWTVTLTLAGDKPVAHTLKLGKPADGARPLRVDDGPAAGVVSAQTGELLARGKLDFADRTLLAFDPAALTGVVRKGGKDEFELTRSGVNWEISKPAKQKADKPTVEELADQLGRLRAAKVAAFDPKDLDKPFGLKSPAATLTLKLAGDNPEEKVLKVGAAVDAGKPDGDRFTAVDTPGKPVTVGVLPAALANKLLADPLKFRDKGLARFVDADKLTLERGGRKVTFEKKDGSWKVTAPVPADAEQGELDELVNALASLRADELFADKPADLKPYGLDKPEAKWTLSAGDKEVLVLLVGAKDKDGRRAFAKLGAGDKMDLVAALDPAVTGRVLAEYRKRAVWADLDASQAESLAVSGAGSSFGLRKEGESWVDSARPNDPVDAAAVTDTLAALAGLKAERFVIDNDAKLALYGLEKPTRVLVVAVKSGVSRTLHLGGPVDGTGGKQVYAKLPDQPGVFVLSADDTAKLTRDRAGYGKRK
jgi:hypothetical protein